MRKLLLLLCIATFQIAHGQWNSDPAVNNLVANQAHFDKTKLCVSDGANGSIIVFTNSSNVYAQRITNNGVIAWGSTLSPVGISVGFGLPILVDAIEDGIGGAYIVWDDDSRGSNSDIYIQHINSNGFTSWVPNGIRVTNTIGFNNTIAYVCSDGHNGAIVAWSRSDDKSDAQVFAQKYNIGGVAQWEPNGISAVEAAGFRYITGLAADGNGGAIISFFDSRDDLYGTIYDSIGIAVTNFNLYAQKLDENGIRQWTNSGALVCGAPGNQFVYGYNTTISDGSGGAVFVFNDTRNNPTAVADFNTSNMDIYAQKLNGGGVVQWAASGIPVSRAPGNQSIESVATDNAGGVVAAWTSEIDHIIYSQKIAGNGAATWLLNGLAISPTGVNVQAAYAQVIPDKEGNYLYTYVHGNTNGVAMLAQKLNAAGIPQWRSSNAVISAYGDVGAEPPVIVLSENGSAIISWSDTRDGATGEDVFASKVLSNGTLAEGISASFVSVANGNWSDPGTWAAGVVPSASAEVIIRHTVTIIVDASCYSLRVEPPAGNVIVQSGVTLSLKH